MGGNSRAAGGLSSEDASQQGGRCSVLHPLKVGGTFCTTLMFNAEYTEGFRALKATSHPPLPLPRICRTNKVILERRETTSQSEAGMGAGFKTKPQT